MDAAWQADRLAAGTTRQGLAGMLRGTQVMTERGEVPVEHLTPGMHVPGSTGVPRRVVWIGQRRIAPHRHPHPDWVQPIRIGRGAIDNGLPRRELNVSPALVLVLEGVALTVEALINGATITPAAGVDVAEYYHVVLDWPDLLLAEGLAIESHRDWDSRAAFGNAGPVMLLHPGPPALPTDIDDPAVQKVRYRLLQRARALGYVARPGLRPAPARGREAP